MGAISDQSCDSLIEAIQTPKIQFSSTISNSGSIKDVYVQEAPLSDRRSKTILSPVVRSRGRPPTLRKEKKVDRKLREKRAREKKAKQKENNINAKGHSIEEMIKHNMNDTSASLDYQANQDGVIHTIPQTFLINGTTQYNTAQGSNIYASVGNLTQPGAQAVPSPYSSAPIHGEFTSLLLGVEQTNSVTVPASIESHLGERNTDSMYQG